MSSGGSEFFFTINISQETSSSLLPQPLETVMNTNITTTSSIKNKDVDHANISLNKIPAIDVIENQNIISLQCMIGKMSFELTTSVTDCVLLDNARAERIYFICRTKSNSEAQPTSSSLLLAVEEEPSRAVTDKVVRTNQIRKSSSNNILTNIASTEHLLDYTKNNTKNEVNNILVVDDVLSNRKMLQLLLMKRGFKNVIVFSTDDI